MLVGAFSRTASRGVSCTLACLLHTSVPSSLRPKLIFDPDSPVSKDRTTKEEFPGLRTTTGTEKALQWHAGYERTTAFWQDQEIADFNLQFRVASSLEDFLGSDAAYLRDPFTAFVYDATLKNQVDLTCPKFIAGLRGPAADLVRALNFIQDRNPTYFTNVMKMQQYPIYKPEREYHCADFFKALMELAGFDNESQNGLAYRRWEYRRLYIGGEHPDKFYACADAEIKTGDRSRDIPGPVRLINIEIEDDHRRRITHRGGEVQLAFNMLAAAQNNKKEAPTQSDQSVYGIKLDQSQFVFYKTVVPDAYFDSLGEGKKPSVPLSVTRWPAKNPTPIAPYMHDDGLCFRVPSHRRQISDALCAIRRAISLDQDQ